MTLSFEWNALKAARNLAKHHITFEEAKTVFNDPFARTYVDKEHSADETRLLTIGTSDRGKILLVVHTDRGGSIRIVSGRAATRSERRAYENG